LGNGQVQTTPKECDKNPEIPGKIKEMRQNSGLAHCIHPDRHWGYCCNYQLEIEYLKKFESGKKQELQKKLFKLIPNKLVPGKESLEWKIVKITAHSLNIAKENYVIAKKDYEKAKDAHYGVWKAKKAYYDAWIAYIKALKSYDNAWQIYFSLYGDKLDALHDEMFPECKMKQNSGLAHYPEPDRHWGYCYNYRKRVEYIKANEPKDKQELYLKLFKLIPDELTPGKESYEWKSCVMVGKALDNAMKILIESDKIYDEAREAYNKASEARNDEMEFIALDFRNKALCKCVYARNDYKDVLKAYEKTWQTYYSIYANELQALQDKMFPESQWRREINFSEVKK
jgi:hypothetical protein